MNPAQRRGMFASIKGHNVKLGTNVIAQIGKTPESKHTVKLVEQHKKSPSKVCVQYKGKKFLVSKSKITL